MLRYSIHDYRSVSLNLHCLSLIQWQGRNQDFGRSSSAPHLHTYILTSNHSRTSSVPHASSSVVTSHSLIHPWTKAERSGPVWPFYQGTGTTDQANLIKLGSAQLNQMSLHSTLVWQLPIIEHKIDRHGGRLLVETAMSIGQAT